MADEVLILWAGRGTISVMRALGTGVAAVCLVVLAACGQPTNDDPSDDGGGEETTPPDTPAVTLETVGGEDWPVGEDGYDAPLPAAPSGFTDADVAELAEVLVEWSKATSLDPSFFSAADPGTFALEPLSDFTRDSLMVGAEDTAIPELYFANVWTDVADYEQPRITAGWQAEAMDGAEDGGQMLVVTLQTRAFYPVTTRAGEETLIAVVRWHLMASLGERTQPNSFTASAGWAVRGVDECALMTERMYVPSPIADHADDEYERHAAAMATDGVYDYPYDESEDINSPDYQERCGTGSD